MSLTKEELMTCIRSCMGSLRAPTAYDKVYKDECIFSFDTPYSDEGLFVSLDSYQGFSSAFAYQDARKFNHHLYLHQKWRRVRKAEPEPEEDQADQQEQQQPSKLAIGVEGGFQLESQKYEREEEYQLAILVEPHVLTEADDPRYRFHFLPYPDPDLPMLITDVVDAIIAHQGAAQQDEVATWDATNEISVSKYAEDLEQLPATKKVSNDPSTWVCEESGMTENLWLNLSTGHIGSGRRNWDGSGGTGAALRHYEETGSKYPLVVKLGTITPHRADVWSYAPDEDCLVIDPKLPEHLSHWGIDIMKLELTDKTLGQMEVELNMKYQWNRITEGGKKLEVRSGPGLVGLRNIGNTCYMNSVLQVLFSLPELADRYLARSSLAFASAGEEAANDLIVQMAKVATGLLTDRYVDPNPPQYLDNDEEAGKEEGKEGGEEDERDPNDEMKYMVTPHMFKHLVGRNHEEFSSGRQQDAAEYWEHLMDVLLRAERTGFARLGLEDALPTSQLFAFEQETRMLDTEAQQVRYKNKKEGMVTFNIPLEEATNKEAYEQAQRKKEEEQKLTEPPTKKQKGEEEEEDLLLQVPFEACLNHYMAPSPVEGFLSPSLGRPVLLMNQVRFKTFPRYLVVQLRRYFISETWEIKKIDAEVTMPEELDLRAYRGMGLQEGEEEMPEAAAGSGGSDEGGEDETFEFDEAVIAGIVSMGFSEHAGRRAAYHTQNNAEMAIEWVLQNMDSPDLNEPFEIPSSSSSSSSSSQEELTFDPETVMMLSSMGFTEEQVKGALTATDNNPERAGDWLFSHMDDLDAAVASVMSQAAASTSSSSGGEGQELDDGEGVYSLHAFISHMGSSATSGHYVCHIRKGDEWVIFNDEKVAKSENTPFGLGYMYIYRRNDTL